MYNCITTAPNMITTTVNFKPKITSPTRGHSSCPTYDGSQVIPPGGPGSLRLRGRRGGPPPGDLSQPRGSPPPLPPRARVLLPANSYCPSPPSSPSGKVFEN